MSLFGKSRRILRGKKGQVADADNSSKSAPLATYEPKKVVALKFDPETDQAPQVSAQASGELAEEIIAEAKRQGIPIVKQSELIDELSESKTEDEIPPSSYRRVAEILARLVR